MESTVERVWKVLPQAQCTVDVAYVGWISDFIGASWTGSEVAEKHTDPPGKMQGDKGLNV